MIRLLVQVCHRRVFPVVLLVLAGALSLTASTRPIFSSRLVSDAAPGSAASRPTFVVAPAVKVSGQPAAIASGDLNGDGFRDLVVANAQSGTVDVLLGDGKGGFQAPVRYQAGEKPAGILVGDFNNDGKMDVAVANRGSNTVSVFLGNGDGTLQAAASYSVGRAPVSLIAVPSGNRGLDLAVVNEAGNSISILSNKGDGTFQSAASYGVPSPHAIAAGDFDGDGRTDLAVGSLDGTVTILQGLGDGSMQLAGGFKSGVTALSALVAADFNHDGKVDLAIADSATNRVTVMLGTGAAAFQPGVSNDVGNEPVALTAQDLNGDGNLDLVAVNKSGNTVSASLSRGDGTFEPARDYVVGRAPVSVAIADFNGDGRLDLASANSSDETISIPLGNGDGTFRAAEDYRTQLERKAVAVGDLNGDSRPDLVVASYCGAEPKCSSNGSASIFLNTGLGGLKFANNLPLGKGPMAIVLADLNGDKKLDLVAVNRDDSTLMVFLGNGDGSFREPLSYSLSSNPVAVAAADFDRDGKIDLAIATQCGSGRCASPGTLTLLLGNGDGSFKPSTTMQVGFSPTSIVAADLNQDHKLDLALVNACGKSSACVNGTALLLIGDGKGSFRQGTEIALGRQPSALAVADLNRDSKLDLIVTNSQDNQVAVLLGQTDGSFSQPVLYRVGTTPSAVAVADFDGDGKLDVAVSSFKNSTVDVLLGVGDGSLQAAVSYAVGAGPEALAAILLADKGGPSLVSANGNTGGAPAGNDITVLGNAGDAPQAVLPPTIAKAFGAATIPLNGSTTLTFDIANPDPVSALTGIGFTDSLPAGLVVATPNGLTGTCGGGTITAVAGSGSVSLTGASLAVSAACTFSVDVTGTTAGVQNNTTSAVTSNEGGNGNTASDTITVVAPATIAKAFGAASIPLNGSTSLSFTITNPNAGTALTGIGFTDTLPAGLVVATPNGLTGTCGGGTITAVAGSGTVSLATATLAASANCTFSVNVTGTTPGVKNNTTSAVTSTEGGNGNTASDSVTVLATPPNISKAFGAASIPLNGSTSLSFTITNPNAGTALNGIGFTDSLPAGLVVATPNGLTGTCGGGTITAVAGSGSVSLAGATLAASANCTFSVNVTGTTAGVKNNTTSAVTSTNGGNGNTASASITVSGAPTITKIFGAATIALNGTTSLSFTITNPNATIALTGVGFTDSLPAGLVVATPNGLTGTCGGGTITAVAGSGSVSLAGATLAASAACTFSVNVTGTTAGVKNNTTSAVTSVEGGNGNTASASIIVVAPATITKAFGAATIPLNGTTSLSFTITNPNAAAPLTGVGFTDNLPAGLVVATPNGVTGSCGAGTITATGGSGTITLAGGTIVASGTCTFSVNVTGTTAGVKNNTTGAVTSSNGGTGNTASASITVVTPPTITKAFGVAAIFLNNSTTLSFTITNPNAGTALTGIGFTDTLPVGLVVSTPNGLAGACGGGAITATAGSGTVSLAGATLAASANCTFSVNVTGTIGGVKNNTTSAVASTNGGNGNTASASISVQDFQLPATLPAISVIQGFSDNTTSVLIQSLGGFASTQIAGTCAPLPGGFTNATCTVNAGNPISVVANSSTNATVVVTLGPALSHNPATLTPVGTYTLTLTFSDPASAITHTVQLSVTVLPNIAPTCATLTNTPLLQVGSDNRTVTATVACSDPENDIASLLVDWGDGTAAQAITSAVPLSHVYAAAGAYAVTSTATDQANLISVVSESVSLTDQVAVLPGSSVPVNVPLKAPATAVAGDTVTFACASVTGPNITGGDPSAVGMSCTFNPNPADITTTNQVDVTLVTKATSATLQPHSMPGRGLSPLYALWFGIPGIVFLGLGASQVNRRQQFRILRFVGLWAVLSALLLIVGCGGGFKPPGPLPGPGATPPGRYFVTITGTKGTVVETTIVLDVLVGV